MVHGKVRHIAKDVPFFDEADAEAALLDAGFLIMLTSRADCDQTCIASCAVTALIAEVRRHSAPVNS